MAMCVERRIDSKVIGWDFKEFGEPQGYWW